MGHNSQLFYTLRELGLEPGARIADFGSQDFHLPDAERVENLNQTIAAAYGAPPLSIEAPATVPASMVLTHVGFNVTTFDVDDRPGTVMLDFHTLRIPRDLYGQFDIVLNAGTSEHLCAPLGLFFAAHHICKVGGIMVHNVPVFGWGNHGFNSMTPKFWYLLALDNKYETLKAELRAVPHDVLDPGNFRGPHLDYIQGFNDFAQNSAMIELRFRRTTGQCFVPPIDVERSLPLPFAQLHRNALEPFVATGSLTAAEADLAVGIEPPPPPPPPKWPERLADLLSRAALRLKPELQRRAHY
jgi:hypothetical protein